MKNATFLLLECVWEGQFGAHFKDLCVVSTAWKIPNNRHSIHGFILLSLPLFKVVLASLLLKLVFSVYIKSIHFDDTFSFPMLFLPYNAYIVL